MQNERNLRAQARECAANHPRTRFTHRKKHIREGPRMKKNLKKEWTKHFFLKSENPLRLAENEKKFDYRNALIDFWKNSKTWSKPILKPLESWKLNLEITTFRLPCVSSVVKDHYLARRMLALLRNWMVCRQPQTEFRALSLPLQFSYTLPTASLHPSWPPYP